MVRKIGVYACKRLCMQAKWIGILFVQFLFMNGQVASLRAFLADVDERVNIAGLFTLLLSEPVFAAISGILLMVLLSDAPFYDASQNALLLRAGQRSWIWGQVVCCAWVTAGYLLLMMLFQGLVLAPRIELSGDWGRVLYTITQTDALWGYEMPLLLDAFALKAFSLPAAFLLTCLLRFMMWMACILGMFFLNMRFRTRLGALAAAAVLLTDLLDMPNRLRYFSIATLARLTSLYVRAYALPIAICALGAALLGAAGMIGWCARHRDVADV